MIAVGDTVLHLADRDSDLLVSGVVLDMSERDGCEFAKVQWSNAVDDPLWSPTANLIKIPA